MRSLPVSLVRVMFILASLLGTVMATPSQAEFMEQFRNQPYDIVRAQLVRSGYRPADLKHDPSDLLCQSGGFCKRYPEVMDCANSSGSPCTFAFVRQSSNSYLVVVTKGETHLTTVFIRRPTKLDMQIIQGHR